MSVGYNPNVADEFLNAPVAPPPPGSPLAQDRSSGSWQGGNPHPTEDVGRPDVGYNVDVANEFLGAPPTPENKPPDPTEVFGTEDTSKRRNPFLEAVTSGAGAVTQAMETPQAPVFNQPAISEPAMGVGGPEGAGPDITASVGAPDPQAAHPSEAVGKKDDSIWGKVKGFASGVADYGIVGPAWQGLEQGWGTGERNPLKLGGAAIGAGIQPYWEAGHRIQGTGADIIHNTVGEFKRGEYGSAIGDIASTLIPLQELRSIPYVASGQDIGLPAGSYGLRQVASQNAYATVLPGQGGSGEGPGLPGGISLPFGIGDKAANLPVVGGIGRAVGAVADPRQWRDNVSLDLNQVAAYLDQGHTVAEAQKQFPGSVGAKLVSDLAHPINFVDLPGLGELSTELHLGLMGQTRSPLGVLGEKIFSEGSLAKVDLRAADAAANRLAGMADAPTLVQAVMDHAVAPRYGARDALKDIVNRNASPTPAVDVRVMDAASAKWAKDWVAEGKTQTFPDYLTEQLTPTSDQIDKLMIADKANITDQALRGAYEKGFAGRQLADAAKETFGVTAAEQASAVLGNKFLDYLRTGNRTAESALGKTFEDVRQGLTTVTKTGLLAFSPRYYLQNLVDNTLHAVLGGGFSPYSGTITKDLYRETRGLKGALGNDTLPNYINGQFGVKMDVGQNFAQDAAEMGARRSKGLATSLFRGGGELGANVLNRISPLVENPGRFAVWRNKFFEAIDPDYVRLSQWARDEAVRTGAHPEIQQITDQFITGLSDGSSSSFQKANDLLARARVSDPAAQATLDEMRRTLPNAVKFINDDAASKAYYATQKVFNNYDLHVKYIDTLMNAMFLFSKYQTRNPLFLAQQAAERPGLFYSQAMMNEDMRNANESQHPGIRQSAQERLYLGQNGYNPLDFFSWDKLYNGIAHSPNIPQDVAGLRQDPLSRFGRVLQDVTGSAVGQFALPFQLMGEKLNVFAPSLSQTSEQPFINWLRNHSPDVTVPQFDVPGVSVGGQPVTVAGGKINTGTVVGNYLSPYDLVQRGVNVAVGRQTSDRYLNQLIEWQMSRLRDSNPKDDPEKYRDALTSRSGPLYDKARQLALDYSQQSRNLSGIFPGGSTVLKPDEFGVTARQNTYFTAIDAAQKEVASTGQAWNDAIATRNPYDISRAQRAYETAQQHLKDAFSIGNPNINVDTSGSFQGNYFPGRGPDDPLYKTRQKEVDENGLPGKFDVNPEGLDYGATVANRYALNTAMGENPAQDYLRKHGQPEASLVNPVNPFSRESIAIQDTVRASEQGFDYTDPRTGETRHIPASNGYIEYLASKPGTTEQQLRDALQQSQAYGTLHDIQTGRGLTQAERDNLIDAKARQYAAGNRAITSVDGTRSTIIDDLGKDGGYFQTRDKAYAATGGLRQRLFTEADRILAQTPGGADYVAASTAANNAIGATDLWIQESLRAAKSRGMLENVVHDGMKPDAALVDDRFLYRIADAPTRKALVDFDNLKTRFNADNPNFVTTEQAYYALPEGQQRSDFLAAHPDLKAGWNAVDAMKQRVQQDDGVNPDLALLRRDNAIIAGAIPAGVARDPSDVNVREARLKFEQWNDAQRQAWDLYQTLERSPIATRLFDATRGAPKKGEPGYTEFYRANGNAIDAARGPYNATLTEIQRQTGVNPLTLDNQMRAIKGQTAIQETLGSTGGSGGGGTSSRSSSGSGGGSARRSSAGGSATALAIAGRDAFYQTFDTLTKAEKAALYDVTNSPELDKALTKGSRPSAAEWKAALDSVNRELPGIKDKATARDGFYAFTDTLTARERSAIRDLFAIATDKTSTASDLRRALATARERVTAGAATGGGQLTGGSGSASRYITAADVLRYGGIPGSEAALDRARGQTASGQGGASGTSDTAARYANQIRTQYPTYTPRTTTTTKKKVA